MRLTINQQGLLLFLVYFVSTEGFGMRMASWGGIGGSGLGWFGVLQLSTALLSIAAIVPGIRYLLRCRRLPLGGPVLMLAFAPLYMTVVTVLRGLFNADINLVEVVQNFFQLKSFLLIYLFAYLVSLRNGMEISLKSIATYALISAIFILFIVFFQIETAVVRILESNDVTRQFRVLFPASILVAAGWMLFFGRFLVFGGAHNFFASILCLAAVLIQLHRGVLIATTIVILLFGYWLITSKHITAATRRLGLITLVAAIVILAPLFLGASLQMAQNYLTESWSEIVGFSSGFTNFGHRLFIIENSWSYIFTDTAGLGVGLDWERVLDFEEYLFFSFVAGPTFDSSYANIVIVFGLPGVVIFFWLFAQLHRSSRLFRRSINNNFERLIGMFLGAFVVFTCLLGFTTDLILVSNAAAPFGAILVLAVRVQELSKRKEI